MLLENIIIPENSDICNFKLVIYDFWNHSRKSHLLYEENEPFQNFLYMAPEMFANETMNKVFLCIRCFILTQ